MTDTPTNTALWLATKRGGLTVGPAPYTAPRDNEIVVRNRAVAVNLLDWLTPLLGDIFFPYLNYPFVLGEDVSGEVFAVGTGVSRFKVGDRVLGHAVGQDKKRNNAAEGAFQDYTVLLAHMASPIPDAMPYENAAVLPLGLSTAACGLFEKDQLALDYPSNDPNPTGKTLLIWGGSTSVGSNAIQLAVAAGYTVVTTASPKNFDYVKQLGASQAFDYHSKTAVKDITRALSSQTIAGALAIGIGSSEACLDIVNACKGTKFVSMATPSVSFATAPTSGARTAWLIPTLARVAVSNVALLIKARLRGIRIKFIYGSSLMDNEVGRMIYVDFLPQALADGRYFAVPKPVVVGHGLDRIPAGLDASKHGATKVVVML